MNFHTPATLCLLLTFLPNLLADEQPARRWADTSGRFQIDAQFVELAGTEVTLKRADGQLIRVPLDRLSELDRQHVQQLIPRPRPSAATHHSDAVSDDGTATPEAGQKRPPDGDQSAETVIAEGVGVSPEQALREAFRAAVNSVVGMILDAETLIKNNEIVEDKLLTYSNAFIRSYDRISEQRDGGLVRVKIRATVERGRLFTKLQSENVAVRAVDGRSLFAQAVTQLEEERDAEALFRKVLEGFPANCYKSELEGEPKIVAKHEEFATIQVAIKFSPDPNGGKAFNSGLRNFLDKAGKDKGTFVLETEWVDSIHGKGFRLEEYKIDYRQLMPKAFAEARRMRHPEHFILVQLVWISPDWGRTEWAYYTVPNTLKRPLFRAAMREATCKVLLVDTNDNSRTADVFIPKLRPFDHRCTYELAPFGVLSGDHYQSYWRPSTERREWFMSEEYNPVLIHPILIHQMKSDFIYLPAVFTVERELTVPLDELRGLKSIKSVLEFSDPVPPSP